MKAMIPQPMNGKTEAEILEVRERAIAELTAAGYRVLNTFFVGELYSDVAMEDRAL